MAYETPDGERFENEEWVTRFMRCRRNEVVSFLFVAAGVFLLGSALTYSPHDPSWNVASGAAPSNAFGAPGAMAADAMLQSLGWAGVALAIMLVAWGVVMFVGGPRRRGPKIVTIRIIAAVLAVSGLAIAASSLPVPETWPLAVGLGGVAGDLMHAETLRWLGGSDAPVVSAAAGMVGLVGGLLGLFAGYGVTPADVADATRAAKRAARQARLGMRRLSDRYLTHMEAEVVHLEPIDDAPALPAAEAARGYAVPPASRPAWSEPPAEEPLRRAESAYEFAPAPSAPPEPEPEPEPQWRDWNRREEPEAPLLPPYDLLVKPEPRHAETDEEVLQERGEELESVLLDFGVKGQVVNARPGPVVTLFEFEPAPGVRSQRVINLADDIARSMGAMSARVAVVPGRNVIGVELPNQGRETVFLRRLLADESYHERKVALPLALGETIGGEPFVCDLARMPHLLIAGTTGSGKSVGINAMILSLMFRLPPERCRFIMVDPKMLELSVYDGLPHLMAPVVTEPKKAVAALKWVVREMEDRYRRMASLGVRNINGFNRRVADARRAGERLERRVQTGFEAATGAPVFETLEIPAEEIPYLVVVIDEMADLMVVAGKEIESLVQRLAQMARAAGIHLITATQRPSVDVITGTIKANFPSRLSFHVTSKIDSRTILGEQGAEQLLGQGDLLHLAPGGRIQRLHGPFVSDAEVEAVANWLKAHSSGTNYIEGITDETEEEAGDLLSGLGGDDDDGRNQLFDMAVAIVARDQRASTSYLQRKLKIGYNRAAELMERLEAEGVVSPPDHANKREILVSASAMEQ